MKLGTHERKELDKFTKFLALKSIQIIVQSRLGEKVSTQCKPKSTGQDWFNLNINDLPDVLDETKRAFNAEFYDTKIPICVEISLRTTEGDQMVLETWCLGISSEDCDPTVRIIHTVYNRMGILLKSLVSITRVTPAYKLSRRQGPDSYVICYRIYMGEPQKHNLGDGFKNNTIGEIRTPIGTIQLRVYYRTKMTISPTHSGKNNAMMVKSDHFNTNMSPKKDKQNDEKTTSSLSDPMKLGAFANRNIKSEKEYLIPDSFSKLFVDKLSLDNNSSKSENEENESPKNKQAPVEDENKNGKDIENKNEKEINLKNDSTTDSDTKVENKCDSKVENKNSDSRTSALTMFSTNDDFIMVDLKTPFASANCELGQFYREWQTAPPLLEFAETQGLEEQDVTKQLETFESDMNEYDTIVQSLCQSPNNN